MTAATAPLAIGFNVPFKEAIAAAVARGVVLPDVYYGELQGVARQLAFSIAGIAAYDQLTAVRDSLAAALATGQSFKAWKESAAAQNLGLPEHRLDNIWRTNLQGNYERGRWEKILQHVDVMPYLMYDAINDSRVRPSHLALDGVIRRYDDPVMRGKWPPNGYRCMLPGTMIRGDFQVGLKSFYSGKAVEIKTRSGAVFSVTANHPILSDNGWVAANKLSNGCNVLRHDFVVNPLTHGVVDNDKPPSRADDVFDSLSKQALGVSKISSFEFHGDSNIRESDVYVAGANGMLMYGVQPIPAKRGNKWKLVFANALALFCKRSSDRSHNSNVSLYSVSPEDPFNVCATTAYFSHHLNSANIFLRSFKNIFLSCFPFFSCRIPCGRTLARYASFCLLDKFPFDTLSFASCSSCRISVAQAARDNASANIMSLCKLKFTNAALVIKRNLQFRNDCFRRFMARGYYFAHSCPINFLNSKVAKNPVKDNLIESFPFEHFSNGFSGQVFIDQVLSVRHFDFSGHVYDFECKNGIILADGIITKNCRCSTQQMTEAQAQRRSNPGKNGELRGINKPITGGADPGWDYHPYEDRWKPVQQALANRAKAPNASPVLGEALAGLIEGSLTALYSQWIADHGEDEAKVMWEKYFKGQALP